MVRGWLVGSVVSLYVESEDLSTGLIVEGLDQTDNLPQALAVEEKEEEDFVRWCQPSLGSWVALLGKNTMKQY